MINFIGSDIEIRKGENWTDSIEFIATPINIFDGKNMSLWELPVEKVTMKLEGRLNKSNMRMLEVELRGKHSRLGGEWFNYTRGFTTEDGDFEIDYGDFMVVGDEEYSDDTNKTTIKLYDAMIKSQVEVKKEDFNLVFPSTLGTVFNKVGDIIGLETTTDMTDWQDDTVLRDEYTNTKYTYRDILDHIAELAGGNISIRDGKLSLYKSSDIGVKISPYRTKKMDIGEQVGKFNILNITQEPQHYNRAYPPNWDTIPIDERVEFVIENNPIALNNTDYYLPVVFDRIKDIEYTTFKAETFGWGIFDVGDIVTVEDYDGNEYQSMITGEISEFYQMFLSEVYSDIPSNAKEEYVVYTDRQREGQQVYLIVDQQNGKIEGLVNRFDDVDDKLTRLELDVDGLTAQVQTIHNGNIIPNLNGEFGYMYWTGNGELIQTYDLTMQEGLTINHTFIPKKFENSLSEWGVSMYGDNTTGKGYIIPDIEYSFKGKVVNWKDFEIEVLEYKSESDDVERVTPYQFTNPSTYVSFTHQPLEETEYIALKFKPINANIEDRLELTEMMFNRGAPKDWFESNESLKVWAEAMFEVQGGQIKLATDEINNVDNKINNTTVKITPIEGVQIWNNNGKGLTVYDDNNNAVIELNSTGHLKAVDVEVTGTLLAGEIANLEYDSTGIAFPNGKLKLNSADNSIDFGTMKMEHSTYSAPDSTSADKITISTPTGEILFLSGINYDGGSLPNALDVEAVSTTTILPKGNNGIHMGGVEGYQPVYMRQIGSATERVFNIYLENQPNVSSDMRYKYAIQDIPSDLIKEISKVEPKMYLQGDKWHFGYIAQDIERALYKWATNRYGLEARHYVDKFAFLHKDESYLSLLYGEIAVLREKEMSDRITKLEQEIENLKELIQNGIR